MIVESNWVKARRYLYFYLKNQIFLNKVLFSYMYLYQNVLVYVTADLSPEEIAVVNDKIRSLAPQFFE